MLARPLGLQVDDDVGNGNLEALARGRDDIRLQPARFAVRPCRNQDFVCGKSAKSLVDRLQRVGVPDHAVGSDACRGEEGDGLVEPARGFGTPGVSLRAPVQGPGVERRRD